MFEPQLPLLQRWIDKPHALEYKLMSQVLDDACDAVQAVYACLMRQGQRADRGRATLTAEQVLRILVVKQLENLSYEQLEFALADSSTFRTFCRLPQGLTPTKSVLHRCLKGLDEACLQLVHQAVLSVGLNDGIESGDRMRADCTCTETNIHAPFDSSLLWDSCRVLTRLTHRARMVGGVTLPFTDHSRKAKHHALAIRNAKTQEQRTSLYIELLALTRQAIDEARRMAAALLEFPPAEPSAKWEARQVVEQMDHYVPLAQKVIDQTHRRVNLGQTVAANDKVVSIFEPHTDIIIKDRRDTVFGHKLCLSEGGSGLIIDVVVEQGNPADSVLAVRTVERAQKLTGMVFRKVAFDGGFASHANVKAIKQLGVEQVAFSKGRGLTAEQMTGSARNYQKLRNFRAGIEATISWLKRCFGLRRCPWRGLSSFKSYVLASVVSANVLVIARKRLEVASRKVALAA
jgi:IS5 family transposase